MLLIYPGKNDISNVCATLHLINLIFLSFLLQFDEKIFKKQFFEEN